MGSRYSRREFLRRAGATGAAAMSFGSLSALLAACSGSTPTSTSSGGGSAAAIPLGGRDPNTLVVAVDAWLPDFDPASYFLLSGIVTNYGIYEGLVRMKASSATEIEPVLAESWDTNSDKSTWTFH